jgi:glycosyltransferase involved in cell wall biosynthesis
MKQRYPTITIGIPAHNEEQNISALIGSILKQKGNFTIERILIICDGCTDKTEQVVKAMRNKRIHLTNDGKRTGKAERLNQLYRANRSDYMITLDADVVLKTPNEFSLWLAEFQKHPHAKVVAGNVQLANTRTNWVAKLLYYNHALWAVTTQLYKQGRNVHTSHGSAYLYSGAFIKTLSLPKNITCDQGFIYLYAQPDGYYFAHNTSIICNPVSDFSEIRVRYNRTMQERADITKHFGSQALSVYTVPFIYRCMGIAKFFIKHPWYTIMAIGFNLSMRVAAKKDTNHANGLWSISKSAKQKVDISIL